MKEKETLSQILLNYGPREGHIIKEIKELKNPIPDNKSEILRRGLHDVRFLADVDEKFYLTLLSQLLHLSSARYDPNILKLAKEIAYVIQAIKVSKYGVVQSEIFESIPRELQSIEQLIIDTEPDPKEIQEDFKNSMKKLANSVDTIFRKQDESDSNILFPILFSGRLRKVRAGKFVIKKSHPRYEDFSSDPKREFLKTCVLVAGTCNDLRAQMLRKKMIAQELETK